MQHASIIHPDPPRLGTRFHKIDLKKHVDTNPTVFPYSSEFSLLPMLVKYRNSKHVIISCIHVFIMIWIWFSMIGIRLHREFIGDLSWGHPKFVVYQGFLQPFATVLQIETPYKDLGHVLFQFCFKAPRNQFCLSIRLRKNTLLYHLMILWWFLMIFM